MFSLKMYKVLSEERKHSTCGFLSFNLVFSVVGGKPPYPACHPHSLNLTASNPQKYVPKNLLQKEKSQKIPCKKICVKNPLQKDMSQKNPLDYAAYSSIGLSAALELALTGAPDIVFYVE